MHDDDSAGEALGALAHGPLPEPRTTAEDAIARGKRRLRLQRIATTGGAAAVVALIAAGTLLFRPGTETGSVPLASRPSPPTTITTTSGLDGYTTVPMPRSTESSAVGSGIPPTSTETTLPSTKYTEAPTHMQILCAAPVIQLPMAEVTLPPRKDAEQRFVHGVVIAANTKPSAVTDGKWPAKLSSSADYGALTATVNGGAVDLQALAYDGVTGRTIDRDVIAFGDCGPLRRKTLADGTVLLLYPREDVQQSLRIYTPGGRLYVLTARVGPDGGAWPVTELGLALIGDEIAKLG